MAMTISFFYGARRLAVRCCQALFLTLLLIAGSALAADDKQLSKPLEVLPDKPQAPDFTLEDLDGNTHKLSDYRGKVVLVHFWSVYCQHCRREVSTLEQMWELYNTRKAEGKTDIEAEYLAINWGEKEEEIERFSDSLERTGKPLREYENFHVLLDPSKETAKQWKVRGLPSTYLVDTEGRILAAAIGERDWTTPELIEQMRNLVSE